MNEDFDIDFVVPWVDGNDPDWIEEFNKYCPKEKQIIDASEKRYRDYGLLKYWFRGVEKFAPWVRKVHFITSGQKPEWLNLNASKLHWVRHKDYIRADYLPVFSSHPIEMGMRAIDDLAEHFVYFNDDFYLTAPVNKGFFFKKGLPCDAAILGTISTSDIGHILLNNVTLINTAFKKNDVIRKNFSKWINLKYGKKLIRTLLLLPYSGFTGFNNHHFACPYTKSLLDEVCSAFPNEIEITMKNRFRSQKDVNQYLFQDYRYCTGEFYSEKQDYKKKLFTLSNKNLCEAADCIEKQKFSEIVLNDSDDIDFEKAKRILNKAFENILPEKSSFEV